MAFRSFVFTLFVIFFTLPASATLLAFNNDFARNAAINNKFAIDASTLAASHTDNDQVRDLAQKTVEDHTAAAEKFRSALAAANANKTLAQVMLDDRHQRVLDQMNAAKTPHELNVLYVNAQKQIYQDTIDLYSSYARNGRDPALKEFAAETLPVLQQHYEHMQQIDVQ